MRRRVRRQDQSSTSTFLIELRCVPGCHTLIGGDLFQVHAYAAPPGRGKSPPATRHRRYREEARSTVPIAGGKSASRRSLQSICLCASLHGVRELTLEQAVLIDVAVHLARHEELLVRPTSCDAS